MVMDFNPAGTNCPELPILVRCTSISLAYPEQRPIGGGRRVVADHGCPPSVPAETCRAPRAHIRGVAEFEAVRVDAVINPNQFFLGPPRGVVEIAEGRVAVAGSEPKLSRLQLSRRQPIEFVAEDCEPVSVSLRCITIRSSILRWRRLSFRPREEPIASCLRALEREGFSLDRRAQALAGRPRGS